MSKKRTGLGRGLDALLGSGANATEAGGREASPSNVPVRELAITLLEPNRFQPRGRFDESSLEELSESIRNQGIVQPIVVTALDNGRYSIIAGERRWRAAQRAGLEKVPVAVRDVNSDQELLELALVENLQRADLNPVEEADAYQKLGEEFGLSQRQIAQRVGKGRTTVTNSLRLLKFPGEILDLLRDGRLTAGQARPLLAVNRVEEQIELAQRAVAEGLSARQLEALTRRPVTTPRTPKPPPDVHTRAAAERLTHSLQTKVEIKRKKRGGEVRIHFYGEDELMRLYDRLLEEENA